MAVAPPPLNRVDLGTNESVNLGDAALFEVGSIAETAAADANDNGDEEHTDYDDQELRVLGSVEIVSPAL